MTPDSIRMIQEGKVFDYTEPPAKHTPAEVAEITALLAEQKADEEGKPQTRKVKAGKTFVEVPVEPSPETNLPLTQRPRVNLEELVEWIVVHPGATHAEIGAAYGRNAGWFATVLVTQEFQLAMSPRLAEISNPAVTSTIEQRFQALLIRSLGVLHEKVSGPAVNQDFALEVSKIGVRALGLGAAGREQPPAGGVASLETLADRLSGLITGRQKGTAIGSVPAAIDVESREVK